VVTSRDGSKVYVISGNSLQLFDSANGETLASVTTATDSRALALSPDGRRLYVTG
jgi:DNA-binding beta-propeller fold protein YncE